MLAIKESLCVPVARVTRRSKAYSLKIRITDFPRRGGDYNL